MKKYRIVTQHNPVNIFFVKYKVQRIIFNFLWIWVYAKDVSDNEWNFIEDAEQEIRDIVKDEQRIIARLFKDRID